VSVIVNSAGPYLKTIPTGPNGLNDYSGWKIELHPYYGQITEGPNRITAKLSCATINNNMESIEDIKSYSVFINGYQPEKLRRTNNTS
jgi:hypothetical protein